jgi:hypothetical protein
LQPVKVASDRTAKRVNKVFIIIQRSETTPNLIAQARQHANHHRNFLEEHFLVAVARLQ